MINTFGLSWNAYLNNLDTPSIPIGPRVAITCGHCVSNDNPSGTVGDDGAKIVFPSQMQAYTDETTKIKSSLPSGHYGLKVFEKANFSYDLALVILPKGDSYSGPLMSIGTKRVQVGESLTFLGKGWNVSTPHRFCGRYYDNDHWFAYATFRIIDFYSQKVGFIATGKPAATCNSDSGGYYFRNEPDGSIKLVGINSWGTENGYTQVSIYNATRVYQGYLSGADDLTSPGIRNWLLKKAVENGVQICGLNKVCSPIKSPFMKSSAGVQL